MFNHGTVCCIVCINKYIYNYIYIMYIYTYQVSLPKSKLKWWCSHEKRYHTQLKLIILPMDPHGPLSIWILFWLRHFWQASECISMGADSQALQPSGASARGQVQFALHRWPIAWNRRGSYWSWPHFLQRRSLVMAHGKRMHLEMTSLFIYVYNYR